MTTRQSIRPPAIIRCFPKIVRHPWIWTRIVDLQVEKWLFNLIRPGDEDGNARKIRQVSFRITDLCNLRCKTCGQWGKGGFLHDRDLGELKRQEVSPSRYEAILADLARHGHRPMIYLWGGEPMLYKGTLQIVEAASALKLPTSIATNGTLIASAATRLVRAPLFLLQMSIDGHCAALHNALRPGVGGFDNFAEIESALAAVRREREAQGSTLPLIASLTVISRENTPHLLDIYETFKDRVDLFVFYLSWWIDPEGATAHEEDFRRRFGLTPVLHRGWIADWKARDFEALDDQMRRLDAASAGSGRPPVVFIPHIAGTSDLRDYYTDHSKRFGFDRCVSIFQVVEVDSNGNVSPCRDYHDYVVGTIKESTISELWNGAAYRKFRLSLSKNGLMPVCSRCCGLMGY